MKRGFTLTDEDENEGGHFLTRFFSWFAIFAGFLCAWVFWSVVPAQAGTQAQSLVDCGSTGFPPARE